MDLQIGFTVQLAHEEDGEGVLSSGEFQGIPACVEPGDEAAELRNCLFGMERILSTPTHRVPCYEYHRGTRSDDYHPAMGHALFLMNERLVLDWLKPRDGSLVGHLVTVKKNPDTVQRLYLSVLARRPSEDETRAAVSFLDKHATSRPTALADLAWSLLASAEFRLNH